MKPTCTTATTADLEPTELQQARRLLGIVFDDLTEADWEHALGGTHVLAWLDGEVIGHAALVMRRLVHQLAGEISGERGRAAALQLTVEPRYRAASALN